MKNNKMQVCPGCSVNTWDRLSLTSGTTAALSAAPCQTRPGHSRHIQGPSGAAALLAGGVSAGFTAAGAVGSIWRTGEAGGAKPESRLTCLVGGVLEPRNPGALKESDL